MAEAKSSWDSPHKRHRSQPFNILSPGLKPVPNLSRPSSPAKISPRKYFTRSQTDKYQTSTAPRDEALPLGEIRNGEARLPKEEQATKSRSLHKRTKSAISLKAFTSGEKSKPEHEKTESPLKSLSKKSKSSTNLAALLLRPKSRGRKEDATEEEDHDKENAGLASTRVETVRTPIWAQYTSERFSENNPTQVSAATNTRDVGVKSKSERSPTKAETNSGYVAQAKGTQSVHDASKSSATPARRSPEGPYHQASASMSKRPLDPKAVETAFEQLLESRNIPEDTRNKMRTMDISLKADFIEKSQQSTTPSAHDTNNSDYESTNSPKKFSRTNTQQSYDADAALSEHKESPQKARPRSFTLSFGKNDGSPTKKQKHTRSGSRSRPISIDLPRSLSSTSLASQNGAASPARRGVQKQTLPDEFIRYFRTVKRPQDVEVGRLQKLRQLLRNETVAWVDSFLGLGGFEEIVALLHRIIQIEWREEHEDTLLHHTLSCVKALATTSNGLEHLALAQEHLFPALLKLLFSTGEDKKGPAEYSTRGLIIAMLFAYLQSSAAATPAQRAATLLKYLRDPGPTESEAPPEFMMNMHKPRPFKAWITEISNVSKEVFWIFLHQTNIIPYPCIDESNGTDRSYLATHFPPPRPPVPAAPYVGSIEWDATNYIAIHLDLLNGLLASLPSREERCTLRTQLRDSGVEKLMGTSLRTCKEKFYGAVHAALGTWAGAAHADGWETRMVREGPTREERLRASPAKRRRDQKENDKPPVLGEIQFDNAPRLGLHVANPDPLPDRDEWKFLL